MKILTGLFVRPVPALSRSSVARNYSGLARALFMIAPLLLAQAQPQAPATNPAIPDWAFPSSPTHRQVAPPADFHRPSKTTNTPVGIFDGQTDVGSAIIPG